MNRGVGWASFEEVRAYKERIGELEEENRILRRERDGYEYQWRKIMEVKSAHHAQVD